MRVHTENRFHRWPGSASKVCVGGGAGGWWRDPGAGARPSYGPEALPPLGSYLAFVLL